MIDTEHAKQTQTCSNKNYVHTTTNIQENNYILHKNSLQRSKRKNSTVIKVPIIIRQEKILESTGLNNDNLIWKELGERS